MGWDWWDTLPPLARYLISLLVIGASAALMWVGFQAHGGRLLVLGGWILAFGLVLLSLSGRSEVEKRGYRNW